MIHWAVIQITPVLNEICSNRFYVPSPLYFPCRFEINKTCTEHRVVSNGSVSRVFVRSRPIYTNKWIENKNEKKKEKKPISAPERYYYLFVVRVVVEIYKPVLIKIRNVISPGVWQRVFLNSPRVFQKPYIAFSTVTSTTNAPYTCVSGIRVNCPRLFRIMARISRFSIIV